MKSANRILRIVVSVMVAAVFIPGFAFAIDESNSNEQVIVETNAENPDDEFGTVLDEEQNGLTGDQIQLRGSNRNATNLNGEGTEDSPFEVSSEDDLIQMISMINQGEAASAYYVLTEDIEITADNIEPIGSEVSPFTGYFDGQNQKIIGFEQRLTGDDGNYGGLFGYTNGATIKNVKLEAVNINNTGSNAYVGGVVGYMNNGTIANCKIISGSIASGKTAGGIVGYIKIGGVTMTGFENKATVSGTTYAGGIIGQHELDVSGITLVRMNNSGAINGGTAGGILGKGSSRGDYTKINNSRNSGTITGTTYGGGVFGSTSLATDCENTGTVRAEMAGGIGADSGYCGGVLKSSNKGQIIGSNLASGIGNCYDQTTYSECYNVGTIECTGDGTANGIGGIRKSGSNWGKLTTENCYNAGKVVSAGTANGVGGTSSNTCYNIGVVNGTGGSYAIANATANNCYYLENRGTGNGTPLTYEQMEQQASFNGFNFGIWTMDGIDEYPYPELNAVEMVEIGVVLDGFAGGKGTPKDPYHIQSTQQLVNMQLDPDAYYVLDNDIEYTSADFKSGGAFYNEGMYITPVGTQTAPFTGSFDGKGFKIIGYKQRLTADDGNYGGLFGYANNATIKNVVMESANINNTGSSAYVGSIVGYMNNGTITNCKTTSGSIASGNTAGGIVGYIKISGATMTGFENNATVSGSTYAGGIIGQHESGSNALTLVRMNNTGAINGGTAGGILGKGGSRGDYTKINNSKNRGTISGTTNGGGIFGVAALATDCENTGVVQAEMAGGICADSEYCGGVLKSSNKGKVTGSTLASGIGSCYYQTTYSECYNVGTIECTGNGMANGIGGIRKSGSNWGKITIENCYNAGKVISAGTANGIGGTTNNTCYNIGVVNGTGSSFAIANATASNCYYLKSRGTGNGTSLTVEQMEQQGSFEGFDFSGNWTMAGTEEYPYPELVEVEMTTESIVAVEIMEEAKDIIQKINALPETITLDCEATVKAIRDQYDSYIEKYDDDALVIDNIDQLTAAETTIADLRYEYLHNLKNAEITPIADVTYNGSALTPEPTIKIGDRVLSKGTDYSLDYDNNTVVGQATVTATGTGDYSGTKSATFTIKAKGITPTVALSKSSYTYDGTAKMPEVTVKDGDRILTDSTDYTVSYSDNTNAGTATVGVKLKGNYAGSKTVSFKINPKTLTPTMILSAYTYTYNGKVKTPAVTVKDGAKVLAKDTDYTVAYAKGRVNAGKYKISVSMKGNYSGSAYKNITINKAANTLKIKGRTATVKYSAVKKKAQVLGVTKMITFTNKGQGAKTYAKVSGNKSITVAKTTGKITVKKGLKKGTYKVKIKAKAAGTANYKASAWKTVTCTIKIK